MTGGDLKLYLLMFLISTVPLSVAVAILRSALTCLHPSEDKAAGVVYFLVASIVCYGFLVFLRWDDHAQLAHLFIVPIPMMGLVMLHALIVIAGVKVLESAFKPRSSSICGQFYTLILLAVTLFWYDMSKGQESSIVLRFLS